MPTCTDGVQNGAETDVDCGGGTCPGCLLDQRCALTRDCQPDMACGGGFCRAPSCTDGVRNGGESDVDCGGTTACARCADDRACTVPEDCASLLCTTGRCGATGCTAFPSGATDTFGYYGCSTLLAPSALPCPDISSTGTLVGLANDSAIVVPLGFSFDFYGTSYTSVAIQSNGALTFDAGTLTFSNACLPRTATPREMIAVLWDDLYPVGAGASVRYETVGTAPNRQFVVRWTTFRCCSGTDPVVISAVLEETTHHIQVCYHDVTFSNVAYDSGLSATVGINGAAGTNRLQWSCNTASLSAGLLLRYSHP